MTDQLSGDATLERSDALRRVIRCAEAVGISLAELQHLAPELRAGGMRQGWASVDPEALQNQGDASAAVAPILKQLVVPRLPGLAARLDAASAAFLDVGVGVAALAIAVAELWPQLHVVGLDPWQPALALAQQNVETAGLANRITLRRQGVETLAACAVFDLAWMATPFIRDGPLRFGLRRVRQALRPGGWIVCGVVNPDAEPLAVALGHFRATCWIGRSRVPAEIEALLVEAGFDQVATLPSPRWAPIVAVTGCSPHQRSAHLERDDRPGGRASFLGQ